MRLSKRMDGLSSNILTLLHEERQKLEAAGGTVVNLSIGTPDLPPDAHVMETLSREGLNPENYKYSITDSAELLDTVSEWYERRYGVSLSRGNITSVYGSQEGIAHIAFPLCDPGDVVLVPDPGYPVFSFGPFMAGAQLYKMPLKPENSFIIDLAAIDKAVADKARAMVVSYPNNPTTAKAGPEFYEKLVHFAKKHDIVVIHDNAYSELVLDGEPCGSFLQTRGALDVGIEFNSLSKSYNLTGMRMSFALGNPGIIGAFKAFRSQIDYGPFPVAQKTAIAALTGPQDILKRNRDAYRARRDALCAGFRSIGWDVPDCGATMFTWFPLPNGETDDASFALRLMKEAGVIGVPGSGFGEGGRGFMRFALVEPVEKINEAVNRIRESGILYNKS